AVQPRQILDDAKRVVERAGYVDQLLVTQRVPRRRILGPRAFHHRGVLADLGAPQVEGEVGRAPRFESSAAARFGESRRRRVHFDLAGRHAELEATLQVGGRARIAREYVGAGDRADKPRDGTRSATAPGSARARDRALAAAPRERSRPTARPRRGAPWRRWRARSAEASVPPEGRVKEAQE